MKIIVSVMLLFSLGIGASSAHADSCDWVAAPGSCVYDEYGIQTCQWSYQCAPDAGIAAVRADLQAGYGAMSETDVPGGMQIDDRAWRAWLTFHGLDGQPLMTYTCAFNINASGTLTSMYCMWKTGGYRCGGGWIGWCPL